MGGIPAESCNEPSPARIGELEPVVTIIYDGLCHLCSASVGWTARRADGRIRFVPAQSAEGVAALEASGLNALDPESFLFVKGGQSLQKSRAVLTVLHTIGGGWQAAARMLSLLPRPAADKIYGWIAANRYKWFGRRTVCFIPDLIAPATEAGSAAILPGPARPAADAAGSVGRE